jgi:hypothetical protein
MSGFARWGTLLALGAAGFLAALFVLPASGAPPAALRAAVPSGWSTLTPFDFGGSGRQHELQSVSCPSAAVCVGVDSNGDAVTSTDPTAATPSWAVNRIFDGYSLYGISCPSTSLCVAVGGPPGNVSISTDPVDGASATWTNTDVAGNASVALVSCPSLALCVAVDTGGDILTSGDPSDPSPTWRVANVSVPGGPTVDAFVGISCPTTTFCAIVDTNGHVITSEDPGDGSFATWTVIDVVPSSDGFYAISCPSESLCVALDRQGDAVASANPTLGDFAIWTFANIDAISNFADTISCASATLCVAGDYAGNILASSDPTGGASKWTSVDADPPNRVYGIGSPNDIVGISCDPTSSFCLAVDTNGHAVTSTNPTGHASDWTVTQADSDVDFQSNSPTAVSCASNSFCAAVDARGNILATTDPADGTAATWTPTTALEPDVFNAVSCASVSLCAAVDWGGSVAVSKDPADPAPTWVPSPSRVIPSGQLRSVSCPSVSLCVAVGDGGNVATSVDPGNAASWSARSVDGTTEIEGVSCPSDTFCVAVDGVGDVLTSTDPRVGADATWTVTADNVAEGDQLVAVSCPSASFCAAVDGGDRVVVSSDPAGDATEWAPAAIAPGVFLDSISCASASVCAATGSTSGESEGELFTSSDPAGGASAWSGGEFDSRDDLDGVSCPSNGMCLVVGRQGNFTRAVAPQSAATGAAGPVADTAATLNGILDPNGWNLSDCRFDYGTSPGALSSTAPCDPSPTIPATSGDTAVSASLNGLAPDTTYFFQLVATSSVATSSGDVEQFTTASSSSTPTTTTTTTTTTATAPVLSGLTVAPRAFVAAPAGPAINKHGRRRGGRVSYDDTAAATTTFSIRRKTSGVERDGRCVVKRGPASKQKLKRCTRWANAGSFVHRDLAGRNAFHFTGRVDGRALTPGDYLIRALARLQGLESHRSQAFFHIKKS